MHPARRMRTAPALPQPLAAVLLAAQLAVLLALAFPLAGCSDESVQESQGTGASIVDSGEALTTDGALSKTIIPERPETIHFRQGDKHWKKVKYWDGNIWSDGCGLCAYAIIVDILNQKAYDPLDMLYMRGDWKGGEQFPEQTIGSKDGSTHGAWTLNTFGIQMQGAVLTLDEMQAQLETGKTCYLICSLGRVFHDKNGTYRDSNGHYVVAFNHDDAGFHIQDPAYKRSLGCDVVYTRKEMKKMLKNAASITDYTKVENLGESEPERKLAKKKAKEAAKAKKEAEKAGEASE